MAKNTVKSTPTAEWKPAVTLDLTETSGKALADTIDAFEKHFEGTKPEPTELTDGWHKITPQIAENLLRHNTGNRPVSLSTVQYYARQMLEGNWVKTGQPIILTDDDGLADSQHRCWACYLSGAEFESYVVTNVPNRENLFAYIDNGKSRTAADALKTAGLNGVANTVAQAARIAQHYNANAFTVMKKLHVARMTPAEVIAYVTENKALQEAAHLQLAEYKAATGVIHYKDVAVFAAWMIHTLAGEDVLDEFMSKLGGEPLEGADSAIVLLKKKFDEDTRATEPMPKHHRLGYITKAYNAWRLGEPVKRLFLKTEEVWPQFTDKDVDLADAA